MRNREIRLTSRPVGRARAADFEAFDVELAQPAPDDVVVEVSWLSIDPYLNERLIGDQVGRMVPMGARMIGRGIGKVVGGALPQGTMVAGELGWQRLAIVKARGLTIIPPSDLPDRLHLGVLGMPGLTAWISLFAVGAVAAGETLLLTSASGTVGCIAGQLAREAALSVVGVASGAKKAEMLLKMGFTSVVDRSGSGSLAQAIRDACASATLPGRDPAGYDVLLDLAGGAVLEAALPSASNGARVILCGHVGAYGEPTAMLDADLALYRRLRIQGFLVHDHSARFAEARSKLERLVRAGRLLVPETIEQGLDRAPYALEALLFARGVGKHLVRLG